jgi:hypothetical protein
MIIVSPASLSHKSRNFGHNKIRSLNQEVKMGCLIRLGCLIIVLVVIILVILYLLGYIFR